MKKKEIFFDVYKNFSTRRLIITGILSAFVVGVLLYFNYISKVLEERERVYVDLYVNAMTFLIEQSGSDCDYTFVTEVLTANQTVPVIITADGEIINSLNIPELEDVGNSPSDESKLEFLEKKKNEMAAERPPVLVRYSDGESGQRDLYVYYSNSTILKTLKFFPYIIISTLLIFGGLAYISYSSSKKAEENRVWVGLAKETAHQLGTPISGLMGWIEVLKTYPDFDHSIGVEMMKDIDRLETITSRFSNIGSIPTMKNENIGDLIENQLHYLKKRISTKIIWTIDNNLHEPFYLEVNKHLIEWVIENICKNAVDAMSGVGELNITISKLPNKKLKIDIRDTGKGMTMAIRRNIFNPGYSTKKRGWGLGLTLAKRIIETYHHGKLFVADSQIGKGTTFRIVLG